MSEIKRLNYFTSQFLVEEDFKDEQAYHIQKRRLHNQWLHSWGVAGDGLQVGKKAPKQIEVGKGIAIDRNGNEVVLLDPILVDLSSHTASATVWVTARFEEVKLPGDHYANGAPDHYTRLTERTNIEHGEAAPVTDGSVILLATVTLDASGNIATIANDVRRLAGSMLSPGTRIGPPTPGGANTLDVQGASRWKFSGAAEGQEKAWTADHPTGLALYVTSTNLADGLGVEFRHSNGGQGIGFGWNTIYATGSHPNQPLNLKARGTGELSLTGNTLKLTGNTTVTGGLTVTGNLGVNAISPTGDAADLALDLRSKGTGALTLTGNTTVKGTLEVTGNATLARGLTVSDEATLEKSLQVGGQVTIGQGLVVNGHANLTESLTVNAGLLVNTVSPTTARSGRVEIVQESWKVVVEGSEFPFQTDWSNYGTAWSSAAFFKDSVGIVHLRGLVKNSNAKDNDGIESVIFELPSDYRPEKTSVHIVASGHPLRPAVTPTSSSQGVQIGVAASPLPIYGRVDVRDDGKVVLKYGRPTEYVSLEGISFRAK